MTSKFLSESLTPLKTLFPQVFPLHRTKVQIHSYKTSIKLLLTGVFAYVSALPAW